MIPSHPIRQLHLPVPPGNPVGSGSLIGVVYIYEAGGTFVGFPPPARLGCCPTPGVARDLKKKELVIKENRGADYLPVETTVIN